MKFNHMAQRVNLRHFETVVRMMQTQLGFLELRRTERSIFLRQPGANIDLQLSRSDSAHRDADKRRSQIAFLSDTPKADLEALAAWARTQGLEAVVTSSSDREFHLDLPDAFVDFVIEAMLPELAEYGVDA
ncbi:hypothetical protein EJV46_13000 [Roseococcus sp. SYP-B2431]|uniref:hypothetical protein n=1 Tax=Roseococcus sp. SYP-B2431 TaxID=2496640 RepID=UPI00103CC307|nr:hypothetical protein [Roseococcus sp. SYP-B2431]TCH98112.1 hypothetical protein EJV46_13000 [Roseococcus sp. SYP-B2431]